MLLFAGFCSWLCVLVQFCFGQRELCHIFSCIVYDLNFNAISFSLPRNGSNLFLPHVDIVEKFISTDTEKTDTMRTKIVKANNNVCFVFCVYVHNPWSLFGES